MNIGTHFDYNNHIAFISTHTNICTPHEKALGYRTYGSEFADSTFLNVVTNFRQCLSPIVSQLLTQDKNENLGKASR